MAVSIGRYYDELTKKAKEYDYEVKQLIKENKQLDKSMKIDPQNVELATKYTNNLEQAIQKATEKVKTLKKAQESLGVPQTKEAQKQYDKLTLEIMKAKNQQKELNKTMEEMKQKKFDSLLTDMKKLEKVALGVIASVTALGVAFAKTGDEISKAMEKYSISAEEFQLWSDVFNKATGDEQAFTSVLDELTSKLAQVQRGSTKTIASFQNLGISLDQIKGKTTAEVLDLIIGKLSQIEDYDQRVIQANTILSSTGTQLSQVAGLSAEQIEEYNSQMIEAGLITSEQATNSALLNDKFDYLVQSIKVLVVTLGNSLMPMFEAVVQAVTKVAYSISFIVNVLGDLAPFIINTALAISVVIVVVTRVIALIKALDIALRILSTNPIILIISAIITAVIILIKLLKKLGEAFGIFGKKYKTEIDVDVNGKDIAPDVSSYLPQTQSGSVSSGTNVTTYNNYNITNNNEITKEADVDDVMKAMKLKIASSR